MSEQKEQKKAWFDELYGKGKEVIAFLNKGNKKKTLRLKFESYYNKLEEIQLSKKLAIDSFREKAANDADCLSDDNFKSFCQNKADIENIERQKEFVKKEYFEAFGKEMKVDEE